MIFARWRARSRARALIDHIHGEIVAAARAPALYTEGGVPDDFDGRFEMAVLHSDLLMRRLGELGAAELAQQTIDRVFEGFDDALREMAVSDTGVAKRMKKMADAYFGRSKAYGPALEAGDAEALAVALARNALRQGEEVTDAARRLASRTLDTRRRLAALDAAAIQSPDFRYPRPEG